MSTILISGGAGMVGTALTDLLLQNNHSVIILSRKKRKSTLPNCKYALWDTDKGTIEDGIIATVDYIVHLAGENVAEKRWTKQRKEAILNSRVNSGHCIAKALKETPNKVKAVIAASAIGWYGPDQINGRPFTEEALHHHDYLGDTCYQWEQSVAPIREMGIRLVQLRIGIVLSEKGGALKEFMKPLQFGAAVTMGSGKQIVSWIHVYDLCSMILFGMEQKGLSGVFNAVSPNPVSNQSLVEELVKASKKSFIIKIKLPAFLLKIILGEMSIEVLKSTTVSADKVLSAGFKFNFPSISMAINELVDKKNSVNTQ